MIEYNYLLERDTGDELRKFKPEKIPKKLDNITYIEGPNSSGKSTLLNIMALGFYGLKDSKLNPALKDKLKSLMNSSHQKVSFTIKITNKDASVQLISEKPSLDKPEIIVKEKFNKKEKLLLEETFQRDYNLIYDIPDNPTQRLNQLIDDIKDAQTRYGNFVGGLRENVRRIIIEIRSSRDPDRITILTNQLEEAKKELNLSTQIVKGLEEQLKSLQAYTYYRFYHQYNEKCKQIQEKVDELDKKSTKAERKVRTDNREYSQNIAIAQNILNQMQQSFNTITTLLNIVLPKEEKHYLKIWEKINIDDAMLNLGFEEKFEETIIHFKNVLGKQSDELNRDNATKESEFISQLLYVLEGYKDFQINIPGLKKSIQEFIQDIRQESQKYDSIAKLNQNISEADAELAKLRRNLLALNQQIFPELRELKKSLSYDPREYIYASVEKEKEELGKDGIKCQGKLEEYDIKYSTIGKPSENEIRSLCGKKLKEYEFFTEEQLLEKIRNMEKEMNAEKGKIRDLEHTQTGLSTELDRLKSKKPHKYQNHSEFLNSLLNILESMENKLKIDYSRNINLIKGGEEPSEEENERAEYNDAVFTFLASRIGKFRHIDKEYSAVKVDLIKGVIFTEGKKKIYLTDMGTGQGQSAYLKGLLNTPDKRKMIVLFDEVAMMDMKSLDPIYKKFKELYDQGKLLVGIVVQKGDDVKVVSKVE